MLIEVENNDGIKWDLRKDGATFNNKKISLKNQVMYSSHVNTPLED